MIFPVVVILPPEIIVFDAVLLTVNEVGIIVLADKLMYKICPEEVSVAVELEPGADKPNASEVVCT